MNSFKPKRVRSLCFTTTKEVDDTLNNIIKEVRAKGYSISKTDLINEALITYFQVMKAQNEKAQKELNKNVKVN